MPSSAPADGADRGTSQCEDLTGGGGASLGKDPFVGRFPQPSVKSTADCYTCTGGDGDKQGDNS